MTLANDGLRQSAAFREADAVKEAIYSQFTKALPLSLSKRSARPSTSSG
jgi:hypothetical protein